MLLNKTFTGGIEKSAIHKKDTIKSYFSGDNALDTRQLRRAMNLKRSLLITTNLLVTEFPQT